MENMAWVMEEMTLFPIEMHQRMARSPLLFVPPSFPHGTSNVPILLGHMGVMRCHWAA